MSREKKKKAKKVEEEERAKALEERKERDAKFNYKYAPCPHCGEATRYKGASVPPITCGKEECVDKMLKQKMREKREKAD